MQYLTEGNLWGSKRKCVCVCVCDSVLLPFLLQEMRPHSTQYKLWLAVGWAVMRSSRESSAHRWGSISQITHDMVLRVVYLNTCTQDLRIHLFQTLMLKAEVAAVQTFFYTGHQKLVIISSLAHSCWRDGTTCPVFYSLLQFSLCLYL